MIISKSNVIASNATTLISGTISSGALSNLQDLNFAENVSSNSSLFSFSFDSVGSCQYVALHGLSLPIGCTVTVTGTGFSKSFVTTRDIKNLVFYEETPSALGTLTISFSGSGTKTISYVQAGLAAYISWGTDSGQSLNYLASQQKARFTVNSDGYPIDQVQEYKVPTLQLTIRNALKTWARTELQEIRQMYETFGILSQLDYEADDQPDESCCMFDLQAFTVKTHSQTTKLVNVTLSFRALA